MRKRKLAGLVLTGLLLTSTVAQAKVISYQLKTKEGKVISYQTDQLVDGFLAHKQGERSEIYANFVKSLESGEYVSFQDDTKKYVSYDLIIQAFLESKENSTKFNVDEFVKQAKGMESDNNITVADDKELTEKVDKEMAKTKSLMDKNMPIITKKQQDEINKDFTRGRWREDLNINTIDPYFQSVETFRNSTDGSYFKELGIPAYTEGIPFSELKGKGERNALLDQKYFNKEEYKYLTDLDNYEKFEGLDINFNNVVNKNTPVGEIDEAYRGKSDEGIKGTKGLYPEKEDTGYSRAMLYPEYVQQYKNPVIWRPDFERGMIEEVNKLRESKGMKPLTYDVNLHAMSRYCVKRNHFIFSKGQSLSNQGMSPTSQLRFWPNGSVGAVFNKKLLLDGSKDNILPLEGNEGRMFNYKGHVRAMSAMNPIFSKPKDFLDYWEYYKNPANVMQWRHGDPQRFKPFDPTPHMEQSLLNPNMTKIGVGSIWEAPANAHEINGALGVFITVE